MMLGGVHKILDAPSGDTFGGRDEVTVLYHPHKSIRNGRVNIVGVEHGQRRGFKRLRVLSESRDELL